MTSRIRNLSIIALVVALLAGALAVIATKPTVLGLDLRGGVELVYEGRPTPQVPKVTPEAVDDAIETIRKRTDALGVSEPEIQRAGANQIAIGLPNVSNAERAQEQVGTTAQLQFYDWEPNIIGERGPEAPYAGSKGLFQAVEVASKAKPKAEATDLPPDGASEEIERRFNGDKKKIQAYYDKRNDSAKDKFYLFNKDGRLVSGPDSSCKELLADYEGVQGPKRPIRSIPKDSECRDQLAAVPVGNAKPAAEVQDAKRGTGPPAGSQILKVPQGIAVVEAERAPKQPETVQRLFVIEDDSELSGSDIKNPEQNTDQQTQEPIVTMEFTEEGRKSFATVTKRIAQRGSEVILPPGTDREAALQRFAITLDNRIVSLATIDFRENPEGIDGRTGAQINGIGNIQETQDLAESLRIGALAIDLKLISQTQVSATLGQQALNQGLLAGGVGLALTIIFLVAFYRVLGGVAALALLIYAVLLYALVKLIPITLTLPGIAGLILTLGIAADANIVIFERIKEEAREGRSIPASIAGGYSKALKTIVDANVVTIGVAFILFTLATAGVKGFAFTLGVGTIMSLFTAVLATSAILGSMSRTRMMGSRFAIGAGQRHGSGWKFDFVGTSKWFFSMSGLILVAGALAIAGLGINFGIDFESGTRIKTPVERTASVDDVRGTLSELALGDAEIQKVNEPELGENVFQISTSTLQPDKVNQLRTALDNDFGVEQADFSSNSIGPTFGAQIARTALIAILASLILISIYIALRFEAKFAVPVLIALSHDILITSGVYALLGREVTTSTVAALLTILGYSLYDTIIVFDRIRENVPRMPRATFSQIVNRSMSEVLTRSLATSFSTLLPVSALMLFGGETLRDFAFALLVGIASGAYSSIFIAAPVLTLWKEREPVYVRRRKIVLEENGGTVPPFSTGSLGDGGGAGPGDGDGHGRGGPRGGRKGAAVPAPPEPALAGGRAAPPKPATTTRQAATPKRAAATPAAPPPKPKDAPAGDGEQESPASSSTAGGRSSSKPKPKKSTSRPRKKHGRR
jgi:SecD/SecF fusion protein